MVLHDIRGARRHRNVANSRIVVEVEWRRDDLWPNINVNDSPHWSLIGKVNASECAPKAIIHNRRESILPGRNLINAQFHASFFFEETKWKRKEKKSLIVELSRPLEEIHTIIQIAKNHNTHQRERERRWWTTLRPRRLRQIVSSVSVAVVDWVFCYSWLFHFDIWLETFFFRRPSTCPLREARIRKKNNEEMMTLRWSNKLRWMCFKSSLNGFVYTYSNDWLKRK